MKGLLGKKMRRPGGGKIIFYFCYFYSVESIMGYDL